MWFLQDKCSAAALRPPAGRIAHAVSSIGEAEAEAALQPIRGHGGAVRNKGDRFGRRDSALNARTSLLQGLCCQEPTKISHSATGMGSGAGLEVGVGEGGLESGIGGDSEADIDVDIDTGNAR